MQNGIDEVKQLPGLQSVASATVDAGVEQPAGVGVRRAGGELDAGQQRGDVRPPASASTSASVRCVQWSALAAPSSTASCTPGPADELVGVHAQLQPGGRGRRVSTARASSPSKACADAGSQNTSIQRAYGAQAASIGPVTRAT